MLSTKLNTDNNFKKISYYSGGMEMKGRNYQAGVGSYRYTINGQEVESDLNKNITTALFWEYDSRIARRWNLDPKPTIGSSNYSVFLNNPIFNTDPLGDSIPTTFYDEKGKKTNVIPASVQQMYNKEYGIKVGYDQTKGLLYKQGDVETYQKVSPTAKRAWEKQLGDGISKGSLVFGYGLQVDQQLNDVSSQPHLVIGGLTRKNVSFIDLADYGKDGTLINCYSSDVPGRAYNMGRVTEHEFFGHNIFGKSDRDKLGMMDGRYNPGGPERIVNFFRREMGLPMQLQYTVPDQRASSGVIPFGLHYDIQSTYLNKLTIVSSRMVEFVVKRIPLR